MLRVVKVGGSLLTWSKVKEELKRWCRSQVDAKTVLIAGGGELVDQVRNWDSMFDLGPSISHQLAMRCMTVTSQLLSGWFPEAECLDRLDGVAKSNCSTILFDACDWVLQDSELPATWDLTSDSISAAVASELHADELVLLKSRLPTVSDCDFVDPLFSQTVGDRKVRLVNLRSEKFEEMAFLGASSDNLS